MGLDQYFTADRESICFAAQDKQFCGWKKDSELGERGFLDCARVRYAKLAPPLHQTMCLKNTSHHGQNLNKGEIGFLDSASKKARNVSKT